MRKTNKIIQLIFIAVLVIAAISVLFDESMIMAILLLSIPLGFSQFVYAILDVLVYKKDSLFRRYLYATAITLGLMVIAGYDSIPIPGYLSRSLITLTSVVSVVLAIYFWFLTFKPTTIVKQDHSVLDLE